MESDSFISSVEYHRRQRNELVANRLVDSIESTAIQPEKFIDKNTDSEKLVDIKKDIAQTEKLKRRFGDSGYHGKALEGLVFMGIHNGYWLNNPQKQTHPYSSDAILPSKYDDYKNRIDLLIEIKGEGTRTTFGFDLTTNPDEDVLKKKILHPSNDSTFDAPVGFGQVKYYPGQITDKLGKIIPRYCIGVDNESVDKMLDGAVNGIPDPDNPILQFKILHEMILQNELFMMPLIKQGENRTAEESEQLETLSRLDELFREDRTLIVKNLPEWMKKGGDEDIDKIAQIIGMGEANDGEGGDETFWTMLSVLKRLRRIEKNSSGTLKEVAELYKEGKKDEINVLLAKKALGTGRRIRSGQTLHYNKT